MDRPDVEEDDDEVRRFEEEEYCHDYWMKEVENRESQVWMKFLFVFLLCCSLFAYNMGFFDPDKDSVGRMTLLMVGADCDAKQKN